MKQAYNILSNWDNVISSYEGYAQIQTYLLNEINKVIEHQRQSINNEFLHSNEDILIEEHSSHNQPMFSPSINLDENINWDEFFKTTSTFISFADKVKNLTVIDVNILHDNFANFFSFKNVNHILTLSSKNTAHFFNIQRYMVTMYRKFALKRLFPFDMFENENISILHRIIYSKKLPNTNSQIIQETLIIVQKIFTLCINLSESVDIPQKNFNLMYTEVLKIIKKILPYCNCDIELIKTLHKQVEISINVVKEKKDGQFKISKSLEKISIMIFTYINDYYFYKKLLSNDEPNNHKHDNGGNSNNQFCFIANDFNRSVISTLFIFDRNQNNEKLLYILNNNLYGNLINEHDNYIESLESIVNANTQFNNESISEIVIDMLQGKLKNKHTDVFNKINSQFNLIKESLIKMLRDNISEFDYINLFSNFLNEIDQILNKYLLNTTSGFLFMGQIYFYSNGYLHQLLELVKIAYKLLSPQNQDSKKDIIKNNENDNDMLLNINSKFTKIISDLTTNNPFIAALCFSKQIYKLIINNNENNLNFYINIFKTLKQSNYKINPESLLQFILENFSNKTIRDLKINITHNCLFLKIFKYLLQISSKNSIMQVNNIIATKLKLFLENEEFKMMLNNDIQDEISIQCIMSVFKCVTYLQKEYFYILNPFIEILPIMTKLNEMNISPDLRMIFTKLYCKYFIESYFSIIDIKKYFSDDNFVSMNLIDNVDTSVNAKHLQEFLNMDTSSKNAKIFAPIISNLERFKYFYTVNHKEFTKKGLKFILTYFEEVIFLPCIYSVYKIAYFASNLTANIKYNVYNIVYLFLECYKFILEQIATFEIGDRNNREIILKYFDTSDIKRLTKIVNLSVDTIKSQKIRLLDVKAIMKLFLDNILHFNIYQSKFNDDGDEFRDKNEDILSNNNEGNSNTQNNNDNNNILLKKIASLSKKTHRVDALLDKDEASYFITLLKNKIDDYNELKLKYEENNILSEIYSSEKDENIQRIITLDLIYRLNYIQSERLVSAETTNELMNTMKGELFKQMRSKYSSNPSSGRRSSVTALGLDKKNTLSSRKDLPSGTKGQNELGDYYNPWVSTYIETKTPIIESCCKLFKTNPNHWQDVIVDESNITKNIIYIFIEKQLPFLIQFIFIEFNRIDCNETPYYKNFVNILEFLRLLCEDHNPIFQSLLINYEKAIEGINEQAQTKEQDGEKKGSISMSDSSRNKQPQSNFLLSLIVEATQKKEKPKRNSIFMPFICRLPILILKNIRHSKAMYDLLNCIKRYDWDYFTPLLQEITDFLIEIIQGTYPENFEDLTSIMDIEGRDSFSDYYRKHYQFLDYLDTVSEYNVIIAQFFRFLKCFIEENSNPMKCKIPVIHKFNPKKLISVATNAFKQLVLKYVSKNITVGCHKVLIDKFIKGDDDLIDDPLFTIATDIFVYLKRVNSYKDKAIGDKFSQILDTLIEVKEDPTIIEENSNQLITKEFAIFCSTLIKENEISFTEDKSKDDKEVYRYKNFFSPKYKKEVLDFRNKHCSKKTKYENVFFMVHPDSLYLQPSDTTRFLEKASYTNFNVKLNCILDYYPEISKLIEMRKMLSSYHILLFLFHLPYSSLEIVNTLFACVTNLCLIMSKEGSIFSRLMIPFAITHLVLLFFLIINWYSFNVIKFVRCREDKVTKLETMKFIVESVCNLEIFCFIWTFVWGMFAVLSSNLHFLFSLQLFSIFNIFPTMRSVLFAVKVKLNQFASTGFLLVILILFYAAVTFYFFKYNDDGSLLCDSYLECFLYLFNSGIRAGGVPFEVKTRGMEGFWSEFVFSWVFYFLIILIILNIVNGIIVDTFQALREQNNEIDEEKYNVCFICSLHRSNFEIKGIDFEYHQNTEHNIENYFRYLLKILRTDEHDLNSIDFQVFNSIKQHKIDFFPIKKAKSLENAK